MGRTTFDFSGQVALVTGGASGIGRGVAEAFARSGAWVWTVDVDGAKNELAARQLHEGGGRAVALSGDVTDAAQVAAVFDRLLAGAGRLDVLVNCAGGFWKQLSVEETSEEEWDRIVDLNLKSAFLCARAAIPIMRRQGSGRIVNVGSIAGVTYLPGTSPPYAAAKAGVHSLTRVLAGELGRHGVTVNAIAPGTTASERVVAVRSPEQLEAIGKTTAVGRIGEIGDMVGWILFLASEEAGYLTGQTLSVNGGRLMV
ncbi:MAG TPA: SDR family NAD(P)-dependent oxidoreductase [Candidatus Methylomirabilis sp.]|nr:SDR family NAD(P)-dependent oxidoreductase [Candidatus Methylomirabilis sp.]